MFYEEQREGGSGMKNLQLIFFLFLGKGGELVDRGDNTYGGKWVVNPSGGLISKGHPLGATGNLLRYK